MPRFKPVTQDYPEEKKFPPRPGNKITWDEALKYLASFDPEKHWSHCIVYVWRLWPIIIKDHPKYIDKITSMENMSYEYMKSVHGGGTYKFIIADTDRREKEIEFTLQIPITEAMPKINYEELDIGHRENKSYVQKLIAEGIITPEGKPMFDEKHRTEISAVVSGMQSIIQQLLAERQNAPRGADAEALNRSMDLLSTAYNKAIEAAAAHNEKDAVDQLTKVVEVVRSMVEQSKPKQDDSIWPQILQLQRESHDRQMELMRQLVETVKSQGKPESWLDEFMKLKEVFGLKLSHERGTDSMLETVLRYAVPLSESIGRIVANVAALRGVTPQPPPGAGPPATVPAPSPNPNPNPSLDPKDEFKSVLRQYGGLILNAINTGVSGADFAYSIVQLFGMPMYGMIRNIGKDNILEAMKSTPEFYDQVKFIMPQVEQFVTEFLEVDLTAPLEDEDENGTVQ